MTYWICGTIYSKDISKLGTDRNDISDQYGRGYVAIGGQTILNADERNTISVVMGKNEQGTIVSKDGNSLNPRGDNQWGLPSRDDFDQ